MDYPWWLVILGILFNPIALAAAMWLLVWLALVGVIPVNKKNQR